jgi:HEAT repeat protein
MHAGLGLGLTVLALVGAGGSVVLVWMARTGRKLYMQELVASVRTMTDAGSMTRDSLLELLRHGGAATILAELLELRNDYARETALELAAQTRLSALQPKVVRLLRDPSARIRIAALKAVDLQRARDDALNEVAALLTDPDYQVRIESVRALGRAVPEKGRIPELLYPMLEDEHPGVVAETVKILYQMQDEASREAYRWVVDHFLSAGGEPVVAICEAIASLRLTEYGSAVARLLKDPSPAVREGAIACLGHLAYAEAIPAMLERLEDSDPLLLEAATKAFVRMGSKAVQPLMDKLLQVSPKLWSAILRALADIMDERDCRSTLVPKVVHMLDDVCSLRDIAETVRLAAGDGLAGLAALRYGELKTLVLDTAWVVLGSLSDDAVAQSIRTAVQDDDEEIRESGLEMLAEGLGDKKLAAAIIKLLDDEAAESDSTKLELGARLDRVGAIRDVWLDKITSAARRGKEKAMDREDRQLLGLLDKVIFLRQVPFFAGLTLEELSRVADIAEERFYSVGARLFTQGESNQTMGVIVEGFVEISTVGEGTRGERALTRLSKAHVYGESSSLYGTLTTASGTVVDGPLHILAINGEALGKLIRFYPGIGIGMLRAAFDRVRRLEQTIAGNAF